MRRGRSQGDRFEVIRRGYAPERVERFIEELERACEDVVRSKDLRIGQLVAKLRATEAKADAKVEEEATPASAFLAAAQAKQRLIGEAEQHAAELMVEAEEQSARTLAEADEKLESARRQLDLADQEAQEIIAGARAAAEETVESARRGVAGAEDQAQEIIAGARAEAEETVESARRQVESIEEQGREIIEQAKAKAELAENEAARRAVESAQEEAQEIIAQARVEAESVPDEADRQHSDSGGDKAQEIMERAKAEAERARVEARDIVQAAEEEAQRIRGEASAEVEQQLADLAETGPPLSGLGSDELAGIAHRMRFEFTELEERLIRLRSVVEETDGRIASGTVDQVTHQLLERGERLGAEVGTVMESAGVAGDGDERPPSSPVAERETRYERRSAHLPRLKDKGGDATIDLRALRDSSG